MPNKPATKGHTFMCGSCGHRRELIGALITHIREVHQRKVSAPEYQQVTERQAAAFSQHINRLPPTRKPPADPEKWRSSFDHY